MPDYETSIKDEPLVLLERIQVLMHTPERAKYPPLTLVEVLIGFLSIKQGEKETLLDYTASYKSKKMCFSLCLEVSSSTDFLSKLLITKQRLQEIQHGKMR